jgi:hypothetical protein
MSFDRLSKSLSQITTIMEQEGDLEIESKPSLLNAISMVKGGSNGSITGPVGDNGTITETGNETNGTGTEENGTISTGEPDSSDGTGTKKSNVHTANLPAVPPQGGFGFRDSLRRKGDRKGPLKENLHHRRHSIVEENCDDRLKNGDKKDEGLGSSLEQSENGDNEKSLKKYDTMEDPLIEAEENPAEESTKESPAKGEEITLDPSKLPNWSPKEANCDSSSESPFNKKPGAIKRVSFLWGEDGSASEEGSEKSYVYDGKANGKKEPSGEKREKKFKK